MLMLLPEHLLHDLVFTGSARVAAPVPEVSATFVEAQCESDAVMRCDLRPALGDLNAIALADIGHK